jgi:hypothetical protein
MDLSILVIFEHILQLIVYPVALACGIKYLVKG